MSATNRGAVRVAQDFYETPRWLTEAIIPILRTYSPQRILEPASGGGAILGVLREAFPAAVIDHSDIRTGSDFLDPLNYEAVYDLIVTNPPFSHALEFMQRALELRRTPQSCVCMLGRLNFLGSLERAAWMRANTPTIHVSPRPPSFTGNGTDATEYAWLVWDGRPPAVNILVVAPAPARTRKRRRS